MQTIVMAPAEIESTIQSQAYRIRDAYHRAGVKEIWVHPIMTGALFYAADLIREIGKVGGLRMRLTSKDGEYSTALGGDHILFIDTIFDTGQTAMQHWKDYGDIYYMKKSFVHLCHKQALHPIQFWGQHPQGPMQLRPTVFVGRELPNEFVFGYGLDDMKEFGYRRELPYIAYVPK